MFHMELMPQVKPIKEVQISEKKWQFCNISWISTLMATTFRLSNSNLISQKGKHRLERLVPKVTASEAMIDGLLNNKNDRE